MPIQLDIDAVIKLVSPSLVAIAGGLVKRYTEARPKLITYIVNSASLPLPQEEPNGQPEGQTPKILAVHTHSIVVRNTGKKSAHNVRVDHAFFPISYRISPPVSHTVTRGQGDSAEICIPVLVPNEQITLSYLYFPPITWDTVNGWVKSDEGMAKAIQVIPSASPPRHVLWAIYGLMFIGASTLVYWLIWWLKGYVNW